MKNIKKTLLAIPTMGTLRAELAAWMLEQDTGGSFLTVEISPFSKAMNTIIETFLTQTPHQYLMVVDSDTVPPDDAFVKMMEVIEDGARIVTAITPIKKGDNLCVNVFENYEDVEKCPTVFPMHPFPVVGCGSACMLMTRELLEKIEPPYFKHIEFDDGKICTGEMYFCDQVNKYAKIMCDPRVQCQHFKNVGLEL